MEIPIFVDKDSATIRQELIDIYEKKAGVDIEKSSSEQVLLSVLAAEENKCKDYINDAGRQNMIDYASGDILNAIGDSMQIARRSAQPARAEVTFTMADANGDAGSLPEDHVLPKNAQVTDGAYIFEVLEELKVEVGATSITTTVYAIESNWGTAANSIPAGDINDWGFDSENNKLEFSWVYELASIQETFLGDSIESDDDYRARLKYALHRSANQPNYEKYKFDIQTEFPDVIDVSVNSTAGIVNIYALAKNSSAWSTAQLSALITDIQTFVDQDEYSFILFTQTVTVPVNVDFSVTVNVTPLARLGANLSDLEGKITATINTWGDSIGEQIGRDIVPNELLKRLLSIAGIYDVTVTSPTKQTISKSQRANYTGAATITFNSGVEG